MSTTLTLPERLDPPENALVVSYSEIDTFRQCQLKHKLAYKERWKSLKTGKALRRGSAWHHLMELWYLQPGKERYDFPIENQLKTWQMAFDSGPKEGEWIQYQEDIDLLKWMWEGYREFWALDPEWEILAVEYPIMFPLPKVGQREIWLKGKADLVLKWKGKIWIVDHKSGARPPHDKDLDLLDQFGIYQYGLNYVGVDIHGCIHSYAKSAMLKGDEFPGKKGTKTTPLGKRFMRTPLHRSDREIKAMVNEFAIQAAQAWSENGAPRSPNDDTCGWKCDFTEACLAGRKSSDKTMYSMLSVTHVQDFTRH